jgi:putative nucleotidyltransferase with HDIG domain
MTPKFGIDFEELTPARELNESLRVWYADLQSRLSGWFSTAFELIDGQTGETLSGGARMTDLDPLARAEICRAVASRGKAEIIEECGPLLVLAIPIYGEAGRSLVAVATFVGDSAATDSQLAKIASLLGIAPEAARRWLAAQNAWQPAVLQNMGQLATERLAAEWRSRSLSRDVRDLTLNLSATYEEISLIYRLTQNLKLTSRSDELAQLAVQWLADVIPAECLAVQLLSSKAGASEERPLLAFGDCPLTGQELTALLACAGASASKRPLVINDPDTIPAAWPWTGVRQLVAVSLCEGANCFGWLVAINHTSGGEFGTVEASLLSSVAAILGIHSGNAELYEQQRELFKGMVRALTSAIDAKDPYTCGHSERVAKIAVRLAKEMGCNSQNVDRIYLAGLLHDIGKIGIDDQVLRKPGKLTEAEYEHIKLHTTIGHRILSDIPQLDDVLPIVLHHHEQWNGQGYPAGLAGEQIPLLARIMAVADSFDAMSSDRPYRQGMPDEKLDAIFHAGAGQQWDAQVIEAFFRARDAMRAIADRGAKQPAPDARDLV